MVIPCVLKLRKMTFSILNYSRESFLDTIKLEYFEDTLINSKSYKEVFLITKDTIHYSPKIAWIIKASDKGIVEFYDFELKKTWNLIDN